MTGEQMFDGWRQAAIKCGFGFTQGSWDMMPPQHKQKWDDLAKGFTASPPKTAQEFIDAFQENNPNPAILIIATDLVDHWSGYYFNFTEATSSEHSEGDVWVFKAGKSRAKVTGVDGTRVKLRMNGIETDWVEVAELQKDAVKEPK